MKKKYLLIKIIKIEYYLINNRKYLFSKTNLYKFDYFSEIIN